MLLPQTDDRSWHANMATPTKLCSRMRLLFEGGYHFFGGAPGAAAIRGRLLFGVWFLFEYMVSLLSESQ